MIQKIIKQINEIIFSSNYLINTIIQLIMKQTNKLSQAGRSSLQNWTQGLPSQKVDKNILLSFKAGSALNKQLMKEHPKQAKPVQATKQLIEQARQQKQYEKLHAISQEEKLMAEVKNLSDFKPVATKQKTKLMVEQIIANKRQQHIKVLEDFLEQTQESYNMVKDIEESTKTEKLEFFNINRKQFQDLTNSLTNEVLLTKDKSIIQDLLSFANQNEERRKQRLDGVRQSLLSLYNDIKQRYKILVVNLKEEFRNIAFVLEDEASAICQQQSKRLNQLIDSSIERVNKFVDELITTSQAEFNQLKAKLLERGDRWRVVNKEHSIEQFIARLTDPLFCKTQTRSALFASLQAVQEKVHSQRQQLVLNLLSVELNNLSKQSVEKWLDSIRIKSEEANTDVDVIFQKLLAEVANNKQRGSKQLENLRQKLIHIGADDPSTVVEILSLQCEPLVAKNQEQQKELLSKAIQYIEKYESLQNEVCEKLGKWMLVLGTKTDDYKKRLEQEKQKFEIEKAKILDDDEQKIDKLNQEMEGFKKELKESLHHPKLQQIQEKCFNKVEELEQHYRTVYQSNKTIISKHPESISNFHDIIEREVVQIFNLVDPAKKQQFLTKIRLNNQKLALRQIQKEEAIKAQQAQKLREQQTKKKGGKAPPAPKPKDPKKAAAELEERKQTILKGMGHPEITEITVNGRNWIVAKDVSEMCKQFYTTEVGNDVENPPAVDLVQEPIKDQTGDNIVSNNVLISVDLIKQKLEQYRVKSFDRLIENRNQTMKKQAQADKKYLTESLQILDDRLKAHYPMKSIIQSQIIGKRSSQISSHKKRYERHARTTREKVDEQTQRFNYLLQKSLEVTKTYNEQRKLIKEELANVKNVSNFQTISRKAKESNDALDSGMKQILKELKRLAGSDLDLLITKNEDFMKQIAGSSQYAKEELDWYTTMMTEVSNQLKEQKDKRSEKIIEIESHSKKKKEELMQAFQKDYTVGMDEMAAKDCAGNKYGKPKMIAQERLRMEMSKCEKAQQNINLLMDRLNDKLNGPGSINVLQIREQLMAIRSCMGKYIKHIEGLKPDAKVTEMTRENYNLSRPDTFLLASQKQQDEKRKLKQFQALGLLSQQKQDKKYNFCIGDIYRVVKQEVAKIYVGDKAKLLNAEKIPDNLQDYMNTLRKNAEGFRLNSIKDLRSSCAVLSELTKKISDKIFESIKEAKMKNQQNTSNQSWKQLQNKKGANQTLKNLHMKRLSPNLANPASRKQLNELDEKETARGPEYAKFLKQLKDSTFTALFDNSSVFLNSILNNFEFLILYYDSLYLPQDFVALPGDQTNQKKHLNLKQLMLMREKKMTVDTTSQRNIIKKWEGLKYDVFDRQGNKFAYAKTQLQQPKDPKKAPPKKQTKDPKKEVVVAEEVKVSKQIQSVKTFRQKSAFLGRNQAYQQFLKSYNKQTEKFSKVFESISQEQEAFKNKWKQTVQRLKKASQ